MMTVSQQRHINELVCEHLMGWQKWPTSCRCGADTAWLKPRPSGAMEMVGCVCHHTPDWCHFVPAEHWAAELQAVGVEVL